MNMTGHQKLVARALLTLLLSAAQTSSHAGQKFPCWIHHAEKNPGEIHIYFLAGHFPGTSNTKRPQERPIEGTLVTGPYHFVLGEGETVDISDGLHSGCTITAESHREKLGLQIVTWVKVPQLPGSYETEFFPVETTHESK
jgi:hypothetical protein